MVHGATLLDIAPTVLSMFGLPVGRDMEGKVLVNAFAQMPEIERILIRGNKRRPGPAATASVGEQIADDPEAAAAALQQLVELGYIEAPGEDVLRDIARARAEQKFNLACSILDGKQPGQAIELAEELTRNPPDQIRYAVLVGQAAISAGNAKPGTCIRASRRSDRTEANDSLPWHSIVG